MASLSPVSFSTPGAVENFSRLTSIGQLLLQTARRYPRSGVCFVSLDRNSETFLTYRALLNEARTILGGLRARAISPGAKIVLLLERPGDFLPAFWACVLGGYIPCPLALIENDAQRWSRQLAHIDTLLQSPLLITTRAFATEVSGLVTVDLEALRASLPQEPLEKASLTDTAMLVLTSGSTGHSKAVVLTHGNLLASMSSKTERQQLTSADVTLNWISFDHVAALLEAHLLPLYIGAVQLHVESAPIVADPMLFLQLIDRYRVSMTFAPNFLFGQIIAKAADIPTPLDLSCLRHIISGGEANVVETGQKFLELLAPRGLARSALWPAFGMTETCAGCAYSREFPQGDSGREFASVGFPITGLHMRIVDESGALATSGDPGELQLRGPMIFSRYFNNEEATRAAFTADGWFRTGDLGRIEGGRLSLVGRSKDSISVSGVKYFSQELEAALAELDGIEPSFVAAFPTRPKAADTEQLVIVLAVSFPLADETKLHQLLAAVRNTTVLLWGFRPTLILPLPKEEFPKTSLGKIQRNILRKRLEAGAFSTYEAAIADLLSRRLGEYQSPQGPAESAVAGIFANLFGRDPITVSAAANFFDLGGTSLELVKLKQAVERDFGLHDLPLATLLQNPTVSALAARVTPGQPGKAAEYDPLVPLQLTGEKTPLFLVHAAVGEILVFVSLANYFVNERPLYALRARGFNKGEKYFASFEEMVNTYVKAIQQHQAHGPYAVAGYSYGGLVAFEIAKRLEAQGERVAFLSSIDGTPFIGQRGKKFHAIDSAINLAFFLKLIDQQQMQKLLREPTTITDIFAAASRERLAELDLDLPKFMAWSDLSHALVEMGQAHVASGAAESIVVFHAEPLFDTKEEWLSTALGEWDRLTRAPNRYVEVEGEHHTIFGPKHVASFQAALRHEINRALKE
jgi:acyl-CoA synthetase (AMP-forming)/AMP-acid ligase II/thioesterase domain-containing protein/acyl carrier protein